MRYKILFVIHRLSYAGASKIMAFLANQFCVEDNEVFLLTYQDNTIAQPLHPMVKHINFAPQHSSIFGFRRLLQIIEVGKVFRKIKPDVIISFLTYPNMISILAARGTHIPVIISERGDPYVFHGWFTKLRDFIYKFADGYVFQTKGAQDFYSKRIQNKSVVIPNPILDENIPQRWQGEKENIIVSVGRLELKQKRQDILIKAFSKIAQIFPDIKLVIFGDGQDLPKIKKIITEYQLDARVILAGVTNNVYESIKKARLFVLSSDYEGIPNALIEAMCVGLPCISTDCSPGGAKELINNMENGILVKINQVDELATAMGYMLGNPEIAETMGQNAQIIRTELNPNMIIEQWKKYMTLKVRTIK